MPRKNRAGTYPLTGEYSPGEARVEHFNPDDFTHSEPTSICFFCGLPFSTSKPFRGKYSQGITVHCSNASCKVRIFHYTANSAIVSEAYRRIMADPQLGPNLRTAIGLIVEQIRQEKGLGYTGG